MTSHLDAFLASAIRTPQPNRERAAKVFWLASKRTRELIRLGLFDRASLLIEVMGQSGAQLFNCSATHRQVGRRLMQTCNDLGIQLTAARLDMVRDLSEATQ